MKANSIIATDWTQLDLGQTLPGFNPAIITFTVKGAGQVTLDMSKVHVDNVAHAAVHGFIQRVSDAAAISRDDKTGLPASPAYKLEAMKRLVAHYESGTPEWSRVREAGPKGGFLFEALCRMYAVSKTPEQIRAYLDGLSDKEQAALREDDAVAPVIAEIKREKAKDQPKLDTKAILAGLK